MQAEVRALLKSAVRPYLAAGLYPYFFARGKLGYDPVYLSLLRRGAFPDGARILDLGCGQGLLSAVLIAARRHRSRCVAHGLAGATVNDTAVRHRVAGTYSQLGAYRTRGRRFGADR
jgi:hypothetical protein